MCPEAAVQVHEHGRRGMTAAERYEESHGSGGHGGAQKTGPGGGGQQPAAAESNVPSSGGRVRKVNLQRPVKCPEWVRYIVDLPRFAVIEELWALHGLGSAFVVQIRSEVRGLPYTDCFYMWFRYKGTDVGGGRSQMDCELQMEWRRPLMLQSRCEVACVDEIRRGFEEQMLPILRRQLLLCRQQPDANVGTQALGMQISPQELALAFGSLDGSCCPDADAYDYQGNEEAGQGDSSKEVGFGMRHELVVEIKAAHDLCDAESPFRDVPGAEAIRQGASWLGLSGRLTEKILVEVSFGARRVRTANVTLPEGGRSCTFDEEQMLFSYEGEQELTVRVCETQFLQAALDKDPLIGESTLKLDTYFLDREPRAIALPIWRDGGATHAGTVMLRYQALVLYGGAAISEGFVMPAHQAEGYAKLRVEVLRVWEFDANELALKSPLVDFVASFTRQVSEVFIDFQLGTRRVETGCAEVRPLHEGAVERAARFTREVLLFTYRGEEALGLRVIDDRPKLSGDSVLGEATLPLERSLCNCEARTVDVPLLLDGQRTGVVSLRYQLFLK